MWATRSWWSENATSLKRNPLPPGNMTLLTNESGISTELDFMLFLTSVWVSLNRLYKSGTAKSPVICEDLSVVFVVRLAVSVPSDLAASVKVSVIVRSTRFHSCRSKVTITSLQKTQACCSTVSVLPAQLTFKSNDVTPLIQLVPLK